MPTLLTSNDMHRLALPNHALMAQMTRCRTRSRYVESRSRALITFSPTTR
jgi:hypothetical protein